MRHQWLVRSIALAMVASGSVATAQAITSTAAEAAAACHREMAGLGLYQPVDLSNEAGDDPGVAVLGGAAVRLFTDNGDAGVKAEVEGASPGDILSVDVTNFPVISTKEHDYRPTKWIEEHGTWDYCERRVDGTSARIVGLIGAHRYVRACLRHSGEPEPDCMKFWYGDNDDDNALRNFVDSLPSDVWTL
ncbi:hypothetical protein [Actinoplanes sp. NPDC049265]|uniref:hypothetical protein n=1 Tax=Actinoplanes sp. NPDC049265 TaxID=3363902 RepID=UPI00370FCAE9